ncbi:transmembrane protein [Mycobacteroides abscessus subsp. abscessus]|nr:transmembrane protein [Mycobacteroides abscessus subsp. abscessus]
MSIHPLAVVLAIAAGLVLGGIAGGLLAVPFVAVMNTAIRSLLAESPEEAYGELLGGEPKLYSAEPDKPDLGRFDVAATLAGESMRPDSPLRGRPAAAQDEGTTDEPDPAR